MPLAPRRGLQELEQVPADDLLHARVGTLDFDVGMRPEIREVLALTLQDIRESGSDSKIEGPAHLRVDLPGVIALRVTIAQVFLQTKRLPRRSCPLNVTTAKSSVHVVSAAKVQGEPREHGPCRSRE